MRPPVSSTSESPEGFDLNNQRAEIAEQFNRKIALLKGMGDAVVGHFVEAQLAKMVLRYELIESSPSR